MSNIKPTTNFEFLLKCKLISWVFLGFTLLLAIFQPYHNLEAGDNQSLKS